MMRLLLTTLALMMTTAGWCGERPWTRHVIDDSSLGADSDLDVLTCEETRNQTMEKPHD